MNKNRPKGITFIGYFYILGAVVLFLSLGSEQEVGMAVRFGVPTISENVVRVCIILVSLITAYGYLRLKKWGYWVMIIYSLLFLIISLNLITQFNSQPFIGNAIWSAIVLIYTFAKREFFLLEVK